MSKKFRIGIVGLGLVAHEHLAAYRDLGNVEIVSVCEIRPDVAREWAAKLGAESFMDYKALLSRGGIDLVLVLTPAATHRPIVEAAAAAHFHVLCEKPLAVTLADGEAMVSACERHGVKLFYGSIYRYLPAVRTAYELIRSGAIGDIQLMSEQMIGGNGADCYRQLNSVHYPLGGPGGCGMGLVDHGIHLIDIFSWFTDSAPVEVVGSGQISGAPLQSEYMVMRFPSGAMGHLLYNAGTHTSVLPNEGMFSGGMSWLTDGSLAQPNSWLAEPASIAVYGTRGSLRIFQFANALFINTGKGSRRIPLEGRPCPQHFATQLEDCLDAIANDRLPSIGGSDALRALRALSAVYREAPAADKLVIHDHG